MKKVIFLFLLMTALSVQAQTEYKSLYEEAVRCAESDSLEQAETLFKKALKLEPANAFNSLLFSNLGTVQRRLGHKEDALESYSMALNFAPLSVPILLNRASLYLEMGQEDRAYIDYCNALDVDRENEEALLYRAYIYLNRRDYKSAGNGLSPFGTPESGESDGANGVGNALSASEKVSAGIRDIQPVVEYTSGRCKSARGTCRFGNGNGTSGLGSV